MSSSNRSRSDRELQAAPLGAGELLPVARLLVDASERVERRGVAGIGVRRLAQEVDGPVELPEPPQRLAEAPLRVGAIRARQLLAVPLEEPLERLPGRRHVVALEHHPAHARQRVGVVGRDLLERLQRRHDPRVRVADRRRAVSPLERRGRRQRRGAPPVALDEANERAHAVFLRQRRRAADERLEVPRGLDVSLAFERDVPEDEQRVGVGRIDLRRLLRVPLGLVVRVELVAQDARHLAVEARLGHVALGERELAIDELHDAGRVPAGRVRVPERRGDRRVGRRGLDGPLVALDGPVAIAATLEEPRRAHPLLRARRRRGSRVGQRLDGDERRARVARLLAQASQRLERRRVTGLLLEDALVDERRLIGRADVVGQDARLLHEKLDPAGLVVGHRRVLLVELVEALPARERAAMPLELRQGRVVVGVEGEDELEALGRARVVEELLVVERRHALVEVDLLPGRGRDLDLLLEVREQLAVLARAVVDAVEALEGGQRRRTGPRAPPGSAARPRPGPRAGLRRARRS